MDTLHRAYNLYKISRNFLWWE